MTLLLGRTILVFNEEEFCKLLSGLFDDISSGNEILLFICLVDYFKNDFK